ncbi:MAG: NfeD family protein [Sedimentisphaerales bacterium]|nr:NfeD family protein [Sedimentisphaerales bacterium]
MAMKIFKRDEKGEPIDLLAVVGFIVTALGLLGLIALMGKSWMTVFVGGVYWYFFMAIMDFICNLLCPLPKCSSPRVSPNNVPTNNLSLIDQVGICLTSLRPSGFVEIEGNKYNAQTEGDFVEAGTEVVVLSHHTNCLVVRQKTSPTSKEHA